MPSTRTINNLVEAWPEDAANFELQAFAASLVDERPALGAPALDRIQIRLLQELDHRTRMHDAPPSRMLRLAGKVHLAGRWMASYAAAACLLIAAGVWLNSRPQSTTPAPPYPNGSLITDQPSQWQPAEPEDPARLPKPAPKDG